MLSFCVLTGTLTSGQLALLQGMQQILTMAKASLFGALGGLIVAVIMYYFLGVAGIVPALISMSVLGLFFSWWFTRRVMTEKVVVTAKEAFHRGGKMVRLGLYTVVSGLISTLTLFLMKSFILNTDGVEAVGLFQAVWSVSSLYVGAILTSMGADYFPRLCGFSENNRDIVRLSNEQTRFVLIVSTPMIVGMLFFAYPVLKLLYSSNFLIAADLLRWQILGTFLKVLIWPVGFILLAKGKGLRFFLVELTWFAVYYLATRLCWSYFGLNAAGIAYVIAYLVYLPLVFLLVKPLCAFKYDKKNIILMINFMVYVVVAFYAAVYLDGWMLYICGSMIIVFLLYSGWN